jgi:hypothetical protein
MTLLSQKIAAALEASPPQDDLPCRISVAEGPRLLTLNLTAAGPVGLAFDALEFATTDRPEWSPEALRAWADRIAARVTYLMEPLIVLEQDKIAGEVALRSQAPTPRQDRRSYYEVRLSPQGILRLARITFDEATRRRQPVPCQMTIEVLERLTDDLVASVA